MPEENEPLESKPELELILLITSEDPRSTAARIARLESIGEYRLIAEPTRTLHDIYLETQDHILGKKRINLRIRGSGSDHWITMKISPGVFARRRHERQEVEVPWSYESLMRITEMLSRKGIRLKPPMSLEVSLSQVDVMKQMGLQVLQDRETERTIRNIVDSTGEILAELEIDSVLYHFEGQDIRLSEVELEAKSQKGRKILEDLSRQLLQVFGAELRRWRYGKLLTGEKIERLLRKGELDKFVDGTMLKAEAYSLVERA
jgi:inorganic triphosphatase YgiF